MTRRLHFGLRICDCGFIKCNLRFLLLVGFFLLTASCLLPPALAQSSTATLSGTVEDQKGAVVPGVAVSAVNVATALRRTATTNDTGYFTIPLLPPGTYTIRAEAQAFAPAETRDVVLNVGDQKALTIALKAGSISEMVQVNADAPLINESPAVGTVVDRQFVANIPLNGRSFQSLITLTPGVVLVPSSTLNIGGQFSVNGQRPSANSFMVDGVSANFGAAPGAFGQPQSSGNLPALTTFGTTQSLVSVDALQEFKVLTSTYAAEFGRQPGGQVSIVTRSGANQFHGSVFDYLRNDVFDANDWFANRAGQPKPPLRQNDFGGTFSGPVLLPRFGEGGSQPGYNGRDRTFFFFSYEGLRLRLPQFSLTNVPTLCLRGRGACPAGQLSAPASVQPVLNAFPLPNGRDLGNGLAEFSASYSEPSKLDATSIRIDHSFANAFTVFGRYNVAPSQSLIRRAGVNLSGVQIARLSTKTATVGLTMSINATASNELRVNYSDNGAYSTRGLDAFGGAIPPSSATLFPSQFDGPSSNGISVLDFPGRTSNSAPQLTLSSSNGNVSTQRQFNLVDNFSYAKDSHHFKFGIDYRRLTPIIAFNVYSLATTFSSQQQVLAATAATGDIVAGSLLKPVFTNFSAYGQDTWKLSRRLTLDLGVRWDINPAPSEANGRDQVAVTQITDLANMQLASLGTKAWKTTYNNFSPRVGVAYQLNQKGETVIRGGIGLFYDTGNDTGARNFNQRFPYTSVRLLTNVAYPLIPAQLAPAPLPIETGLPTPYPGINAYDPNLRLPYTWQWSLAAQQSLGMNQALTVSYVGAAARRLLQQTSLSLRPINPRFTTVFLTTNNATSDYHALQIQFQRRLSRGFQTLASYTWSHSLDDDSGSDTGRIAQRGNSIFDVRHVFSAAATYNLPERGKGSRTGAILGHWSIDTSIHAQSALPVDLIAATLVNPADGSLIGVRPNVIPDVPLYLYGPQYPGGRTINNTIPSATQIAAAGCRPGGPAKGPFCTPPTGQSGNLGRNQVRGLPAWQVDAAIRREFRLSEDLNLQFRAEAFNVLNHPNFGTIQTTLSAANFGQATNMLNRQLGGISQLYQIGGPRSFQFALKLLF